MARKHRWSMMIYGTLQAEFMETKYKSHIHRLSKLSDKDTGMDR